MTLDETRQLGIEFERRVQIMIPDKEFSEKLDTLTIYSFLNQYQDKYIHDIYRNLDRLQSGTNIDYHVESILQSLLKEKSFDNITKSNVDNSVTLSLDPAFYMYVRSVSNVMSTYSFKTTDSAAPKVLTNQLVSLSEVNKTLETAHNSLRILRNPIAVLSPSDKEGSPTLTIIYDRYTSPISVDITYYKQPSHFDIITGEVCELPTEAFDDLVSGAVDLYVEYVAGAEARKRSLAELALKRAREDQRDARRSGGNQDEQS